MKPELVEVALITEPAAQIASCTETGIRSDPRNREPVSLIPLPDGKYEVDDGRHRVGAAIAWGESHILAYVRR